MESIVLYTLLSVCAVSAVSFIGLFGLSLNEHFLKKITPSMVGLAAGALLGDAIIHLIPESIESMSPLLFSISVLLGILFFFILEKFLQWHHHHNQEHAECVDVAAPGKKPLGTLILVGDGVHNFVDGALIAASFVASPALGVATTVAVFLHEIPQEISDFTLLLHAGYSRIRALVLNGLSALTAVLGAFAFFWAGNLFTAIEPVALAFTAGGFIYIAAADLIPELHEAKHPGRSALQLIAMLIGIAIMFALLLVE